MTANSGQIGNGATLTISNDTNFASSTTSLGNITSLGLPDMSVDDVDITSMGDSDTTQYRSFVAGLIDAGELSIEINFERSNYEQCFNDLGDDSKYFQIIIPGDTNSTLEFKGYIKSLGGAAPQGDVITAPITIKAAGKPTLSLS